MWIRFAGEVDPDDDPLARSLLAYASDVGLVSTGVLPHLESISRAEVRMASLDHALWFHRAVPIADWLLVHKRTTMARGGRALIQAEIFSRDGKLVASVSQEGLIRRRRAAPG